MVCVFTAIISLKWCVVLATLHTRLAHNSWTIIILLIQFKCQTFFDDSYSTSRKQTNKRQNDDIVIKKKERKIKFTKKVSNKRNSFPKLHWHATNFKWNLFSLDFSLDFFYSFFFKLYIKFSGLSKLYPNRQWLIKHFYKNICRFQ